ncbi:MAG: MBL fold metallo-hydrolase [Candidatus Thorarchaeota archaeon]|nr:MBL fold metallo-hydrolase [Candidatus Thorarchaeota archaeon]
MTSHSYATMPATQIAQGVYVVKGKFVENFGFIQSYLFIHNDEIAVIDPGTAGHPGEEILNAIDRLGYNPRQNVVAIVLTHGHPDHVGGAARLKKATGAPVMIHEGDAPILENPSRFIKERLLLDAAGRLAMKVDRTPLRVNYRGIKPDRLLKHGDDLHIGGTSFRVISTRGHSAGHCAFYSPRVHALFSGDEVNNYPNDPRKFFVDLSGSLSARSIALKSLSKLTIEYLLPAHDTFYLFNDIALQFSGALAGIEEFQDAVLQVIAAREEADIQQIAFDIIQGHGVLIPTGHHALLPTTISVALRNLTEAGLLHEYEGVWKVV